MVQDIYGLTRSDPVLIMRVCNGHLHLNMIEGSINMRCPRVECLKQYDITRVCSVCGFETTFDDTICDICEPKVIDIATWSVSRLEGLKAIKKINRAFKNDLVKEEDWITVRQLNMDEVIRCEKNLEREGISFQSTS